MQRGRRSERAPSAPTNARSQVERAENIVVVVDAHLDVSVAVLFVRRCRSVRLLSIGVERGASRDAHSLFRIDLLAHLRDDAECDDATDDEKRTHRLNVVLQLFETRRDLAHDAVHAGSGSSIVSAGRRTRDDDGRRMTTTTDDG